MEATLWNDPQLRAVIEEGYRRGYCVVLTPRDGHYRARLYCVGDFTKDREATGHTPVAAVQNALSTLKPGTTSS